jgi:hypothetical protein
MLLGAQVLRRWKMLRALLQTIAMSLESLLPLVFLLILVIFIAALVGMEIFGGSSPVDTLHTKRTPVADVAEGEPRPDAHVAGVSRVLAEIWAG